MVLMVSAILISTVASSMAAEIHKVGESTGWTNVEMPDYKKWSFSKSFKIGDSILFEYQPRFQNVFQVNHDNFQKCNTSTPIKTFTSGKDLILLKAEGNLFFISGITSQCEMGQKVEIMVGPNHVLAANHSTMTLDEDAVLVNWTATVANKTCYKYINGQSICKIHTQVLSFNETDGVTIWETPSKSSSGKLTNSLFFRLVQVCLCVWVAATHFP